MRRVATACLAGVLVAGCTLGPDYARPPVDAPASFRFAIADAADTANTEWWKQFGDPVLDTLIAEALAHNLNVRIAAANVEQAAGVLTQARAPLFPQIGYTATGERDRTPQANYPAELAGFFPNPKSAYQVWRRRAGSSTCGAGSGARRRRRARTCSRPTTRGAA